jgi:hypothetical protein
MADFSNHKSSRKIAKNSGPPNRAFRHPILEKAVVKEKSPTGQSDPLGKQMASRVWSPMDYYFDHLKETIASAPSGGTEFGEKIKTCAEQNISATQEYVRELTYAKDIQDIVRIQMEFLRRQLASFGEQAKDLGEAYIKAATTPPQSR